MNNSVHYFYYCLMVAMLCSGISIGSNNIWYLIPAVGLVILAFIILIKDEK